ncbi:MAG: beta-galactosidase, partial [Bacteroidaceae bacterium]
EDMFVLSAAFHYFRCPQELWRDRFRKIKEAGFNTVETYVPWNWHERNMPKSIDDFSQCNFDDLKAWLKMAHEEFGFYTIVRPGPFICAEWAGGAYPRWLAKYRAEKYDASFWLRSAHPEHVKWARHWYRAVCRVFESEQLTCKPKGAKGILMVQLENEYIYFGMESAQKVEFLRELADVSAASGIDVPLFTCVTPEVRGSKDQVVSQLFDMDNQYVWWNMQEAKTRLENLKKEQPNAPAFVCELQGGWFSTVGGGLSEDSYLDGRHARGMALMGMAGGGTGLNYYMFFGGTHFAGWGARRMTTTYDYGAPLKENGGVGEKYAAVRGIGEIVAKFGKQLARSHAINFTTPVNPDVLTVGIREAKDGTRFFFFLNRQKKEVFEQVVRLIFSDGTQCEIPCRLNPLDSKMWVLPSEARLSGIGQWYPNEQVLPTRPSTLPSAIRVTEAYVQPENFNGKWMKLTDGVSLPEIEINDCRYSMYKSRVKLTAQEVKQYGSLVCEMFSDDPLYVQVNGQILNRASADEFDNTFALANTLLEGNNEIIAIYENRGHAHGYLPMEELSGIKRAGLGKVQSAILPIEEWSVKDVTN